MTAMLDLTTSTCLAASLHDVSKSYKHFELKHIDLEFPQGTVTGLIGPNGAGKSTTMRILMGLVRPDAGTVAVLGQPVSSSQAHVKSQIGYFSEDMRLYKAESIGWHMQFVRSLFPSWDDAYANQLLDRFGLIDEQAVKGLSHGQRVKAMLLLLLARRPKLLILDEPTNGLDPVAKHEILTELMKVVEDEDRTILYSSHNTQDIEQISDSIIFIDRGQVIAAKNKDEYLEGWKRIKLHAPEGWQPPAMPGLRLESSFRNLRSSEPESISGRRSRDSPANGSLDRSHRTHDVRRDFCEFSDARTRGGQVMNIQAIQILFLKDLFLSRRPLFGYFAAGLGSTVLACIPNPTIGFVGFILVMTVAIAAGIHLIGLLLLAETSDQTRLFVMSLPISLLDYSIAKIAVVLTTYLIPWLGMFACSTIFAFVLPWAKQGSVVVLPAIFFFLLSSFMLQLVVAVVTESVGWTICVMVAGNVLLNVLLMKLFGDPEISAITKSDALTWPPLILQILAVEVVLIVSAFGIALFYQTRNRDLI